jgi:ADP-ribose pyrophosphatase YjhB (NUDIX family)
MSKIERETLLRRPFRELFREARLSNNMLSSAETQYRCNRKLLESLLSNADPGWDLPEWGFPKGRIQSRETRLECAMRECYEEIGIRPRQLRVYPLQEQTEESLGSDSVTYLNRYYTAEILEADTVHLKKDDNEIRDICWCTLSESHQRFTRACELSKLAILDRVDRLLDGVFAQLSATGNAPARDSR